MSPTDLNNQSFGRRVKKLETQGAKHSRQLDAAAEQQTKVTAADVRNRTAQKRQQLEQEIDAHTNQMPPAQPPGWMMDAAASARLENFKSLNRQPQTPVPEAMTAPWELKQMQATHNRRIGESLGRQQQAEQQWRLQHEASINQMRQQRALTHQPQSRSRGRHDDGIQF